MAKTINFSMEVTDEEAANFLARFAERGNPVAASSDGEDDETGPAASIAPGEVDSAGNPWVEAAHSSKKTKNADGTWRLKKGVTKEQADAAIQAMRNVPAAVGGMPTGAAPAPAAGLPTGLPTGMPTGMPTMPVSAPAPAPVSYQDVIDRYQALAGQGKVTGDSIGGIYQAAGVTNPSDLQSDETLRRKLMDEFAKFG